MTKTTTFATIADLAGQEVGASDWLLIDQDRVNLFADRCPTLLFFDGIFHAIWKSHSNEIYTH
jgi:hypothetical protein